MPYKTNVQKSHFTISFSEFLKMIQWFWLARPGIFIHWIGRLWWCRLQNFDSMITMTYILTYWMSKGVWIVDPFYEALISLSWNYIVKNNYITAMPATFHLLPLILLLIGAQRMNLGRRLNNFFLKCLSFIRMFDYYVNFVNAIFWQSFLVHCYIMFTQWTEFEIRHWSHDSVSFWETVKSFVLQ